MKKFPRHEVIDRMNHNACACPAVGDKALRQVQGGISLVPMYGAGFPPGRKLPWDIASLRHKR